MFKPTLLVGSVLHGVHAIAVVCDHGIRAAAGWTADPSFDVVASVLCESTSIHGEVCGRVTEYS